MTFRMHQLALALACIAVFAAKPASAQQLCGMCSDEPGYEYNLNIDWVHVFGQSGALLECSETGGCHQIPGISICARHHLACRYALEAVDEITDAVDRSDIRALRTLLAAYDGRVRPNERTGSVDVLSCEGTLLARITAPEHVLTQIRV